MDFKEKLETIKKVLSETAKKYGIGIYRIMLFGSRARGDYTKDSDWDILIITNEKLDRKTKYEFLAESRRRIVWAIDDPVDIIIIDKEHYEKFKNFYGDIAGIATLEGISL